MPDEPLSALLYALLQAADEAGRVLAGRLGTGVTDAEALQHLLTSGPMGPADLGRLLGMGSAAATGLADRLERAGHIVRRAHPGDRRRLQLVPTERARCDVWAALQPLIARIDAVESTLDERDRDVIARYLAAVTAAYHEHSTADRIR